MISAFGSRAKRYAPLLGDLDAVICEQESIGEAYLEAVRRRETGETFYGMLLVDEPRVAFGYRHGGEILAQIADFDRRRLIIDQLALGNLPINGTRAGDLWALDAGFERVAVEFLGLCDATLVRSFAEYGRIADMFARNVIRRPTRPVERVLARASVPDVPRTRPLRPGVVVWPPQRPATETALLMHGLSEFHGDITCVSAGGPLPSYSRATFLLEHDPRVLDALGTAAAVVCAEPNDPADAVAFARLGYGVVAPITSGAHEFAGEIVPWDALDARFLFTAVAVAVARPAMVRAEPPPPPRAPGRPQRPAFITELPLVSVVTATYNRRNELHALLTRLAAQSYPNLESIVVNDAGAAVDDVVAQFPFARLINLPENGGAAHAFEVGRAAAHGEFIALLPDDDTLYPDHLERLLNAMFRSGCAVAHGAALLRYLEREPDGAWRTVGFNGTTFSETLAPSDALVTSTIGTQQALIATAVYDEVGWYLPDNLVADNEIQARICKRYFYAFADHVTAEFRDHPDGAGRKANFVDDLKRVYSEIHPVSGRPLIDRIRQSTLDNIAARDPNGTPFPMTLKLNKVD
jgi:Glycosyl transferase family 2